MKMHLKILKILATESISFFFFFKYIRCRIYYAFKFFRYLSIRLSEGEFYASSLQSVLTFLLDTSYDSFGIPFCERGDVSSMNSASFEVSEVSEVLSKI